MIAYPDNPRDRAAFSALPIVLAPTQDPLPEIEIGATRLVLARDGIYIEARTRVLHARGQIAETQLLPYGEVLSTVEVQVSDRFDTEALLEQAGNTARVACPNEWAGLIVHRAGDLMLYTPQTIEASPHRISYISSEIDPLDILWDIHSHGHSRAYFSGQDDRDDLASPCPCYFAAVVGRLSRDRSKEQIATRLIIGGRAFDEEALELGVHLGGAR